VDFDLPLHITLKLRAGLPSLRTEERMAEFLYAVDRARTFGLHVIHFALESNHIHLIAEAADNASLARGMKSLCGRFGKIIRRAVGGVGAVFVGRFHLHSLRTPTEMFRALSYVLLNHARHAGLIAHIDRFSSGTHFRDWHLLLKDRFCGLIEEQAKIGVRIIEELSSPRSWLCRMGWKLARRGSSL
jgi:REP element-mobilizing transposase RayT